MAAHASNASDGEDINDFLRRIKELGEQRDREDEERTRKLEEEIMAGRRERQARRAERARSISPQKTSPTASPSSTADRSSPIRSQQLADPPIDFSPSSSPQPRNEVMENPNGWFRDGKHTSQDYSPAQPPSPTRQSGSLGRSGTLSWQQRPSSRDSTSSRHRPLSSLAMENAAAKAISTPPKQSPMEEVEMSRSQISQSLGAKDPTWFRQTADRGAASPAYRRSQQESSIDNNARTGSMRLPGTSREPTVEREKSPDISSDYERSSSSRLSQTTIGPGERYASVSSISSGGLGSPMPMSSSQKLDPTPSSETATLSRSDSMRLAMSPSQGQLGTNRPPSPTKGMGGFVQSAMMKRSDSVKRWSAQPAVGLSRGNSISGNRSSVYGLGLGAETATSKLPDVGAPVRSPELGDLSKLTIDTSTDTGLKEPKLDTVLEPQESSTMASSKNSSRRIPASASSRSLPSRDRSDSSAKQGTDSLPTSPSKTMDPKRWSPTKSTWLESALNKPESLIKSPPPQQPSWMSEIQKTKQAKADGEESKGQKVPFGEVQTQGLLKSPPMGGHSRPLSIRGLPTGFPSGSIRSQNPSKSLSEVLEQKQPHPMAMKKSETTESPENQQPHENNRVKEADSKLATEKAMSQDIAPAGEKVGAKTPDAATASEAKPVLQSQLKPKPQTPPQPDLRGGLRSRGPRSNDTSNDQLEFKNVFGNLKRTQTKNYVAPDTFKDNITRGKAALNVTGGPKKTARVDEFKESLVKQKEAMKAGGGSIREKTNEPPVPRKPSTSIPEALAKRNALGRSDTTKADSDVQTPELPSWKTRTVSQEKSSDTSKPTTSAPPLKWSERQALLKKAAAETAAAEAALPPKKIPEGTRAAETKTPISDTPRLVAEPKSFVSPSSPPANPAKQSSSGSGSKLADRLNPALLAALSRGPSPRPTNESAKTGEQVPAKSAISKSAVDSDATGATLTHITKGRARGPKRRAPNATKSEPMPGPTSTIEEPEKEVIIPEPSMKRQKPAPRPLADLVNNNEKIRKQTLESPKSTSSTPQQEDVASPSQARSHSVTDKPRPKVAAKSPEVRRVSSQILNSAAASPTSPSGPLSDKGSRPADLSKPKARTPVSSNSGMWPNPDKESTSVTLSKADVLSLKRAPLPLSKPNEVPKKSPKEPSTASKPASNVVEIVEDHHEVKGAPAEPTTAASVLSLFDSPPSVSTKIDVDPQNILLLSPVPEKVQTHRAQIFTITGDGKTFSLSSDQEYILHSDQMYLVVHEFSYPSQPARKETEVYLWTGSQVPAPSVEDAQLFGRKIARDHSAKLLHLPAGTEISRFLSALGGVGVFRRSSQKTESSFYMLRARRHLFHIAFDEVPFSSSSLCSGFCYIISAKFGKLWIWKGKGASADELGTARLIGMNLSLLGEIEEVTEGEEPDSFFESFPAGTAKSKAGMELSSIHWTMKARNDNYTTRLFKVDHNAASRRPSSSGSSGLGSLWGRRTPSSSSSPAPKPSDIFTEISPFSQADLTKDSTSAIFILDAWFEIYIFIPRSSTSSTSAASFSTALHFSQEYSILSVSLQDRPLMPSVKILVGDTSRDFRLCFRSWDLDREAQAKNVWDGREVWREITSREEEEEEQ